MIISNVKIYSLMIYLYFSLSLSVEIKIRRSTRKTNDNFLFPFFLFIYFFIFSNREPDKSFYPFEVLCSNTARMASGGQWILLDNDWEQRSSGLL